MIFQSDIYNVEESVVYLFSSFNFLSSMNLEKSQIDFARKYISNENNFLHINCYYKSVFLIYISENKKQNFNKIAKKIYFITKQLSINELNIIDFNHNTINILNLAEYIVLLNYSFNKYKNVKDKDYYICIKLISNKINLVNEIVKINASNKAVNIAKNIVNEPLSYMTAKKLAETIESLFKTYNIKTEILGKKDIENLKMGGLLAVNKGSIEEPSFSIIKYEPENAINEQAIVIIGKGIVFDTGGINLKPSGFLETMKSDKSGAAVVVASIVALVEAKIPLKVYALVPATDNRPGANAYVPQDIITMYDGTTVEVLNTDAEGRLILADALAFAKQYNPLFVIDIATLTGAAIAAVGTKASIILSNDELLENNLIKAGFTTNEKLVKLPLWDEYYEELKSPIADLKNIGGKYAGAITAAKFLEHFTNYKWAHIDIAGTSFNETDLEKNSYGATAFGVRLLFNFFSSFVNNNKIN